MTVAYATYYTIPPISGAISTPGAITGGGMCSPGAFAGVATFGGTTAGAMSGGGTPTVPGFVNFTVPGTLGTGYFTASITIQGLGAASAGSIWDVVLDGTTSLGTTTIVAQATDTPSGTVTTPILVGGTTHNWSVVNLSQDYVGQLFTLPGYLGHSSLNSTSGTFTLLSCCFSVTIVTSPLGAPALTISTPTDQTLTASWSSGYVPTPTSYTLQYRRTGTTSWTQITGITGLSQVVTGLTPASEYDFQLEAVNSSGTSGFGPTVNGTTQAAVPSISGPTINAVSISGTPGSVFTFALSQLITTGFLLCVTSKAVGAAPPATLSISGSTWTWTKLSSKLITGLAVTAGASNGQMYVDMWYGTTTHTGIHTQTLTMTGSTSAGANGVTAYSASIINFTPNLCTTPFDPNASLPQVLSSSVASSPSFTYSTSDSPDLLINWLVGSGSATPPSPSGWALVPSAQPAIINGTVPYLILPYIQNPISPQSHHTVSLTTSAGSVANLIAFTAQPPPSFNFSMDDLTCEQITTLSSFQDRDVTMRWSDDGGANWSQRMTQSMGDIGEFNQNISFRRLGLARNRVFELSWSSPIQTALSGVFISYKMART